MASTKPFNHTIASVRQANPSYQQKYLRVTASEEEELLSLYFKQLQKFPPLKAEESQQLALQILQGDETARDRLIQHHLRLVVKIAQEFKHRGILMADLIEEGNIGLIHAVKKFDPHKGYRFTTYAVWWIRQAIAKAVMDQSRTIRLPKHVLKMMNDLLKKNIALTQTLQHPPSEKELSRNLYFGPEDLHKLQQIIHATKMESLDDQSDVVDAAWITTQNPDCFDLVANQDLHQFILLFLKELRADEKEVIARRFGLLNFEVQTLETISQDLGCTKERVRQIQLAALKRLRAILNDYGLHLGSFELH